MKRLVLIIACTALALLVLGGMAAFWLVRSTGKQGTTSIESWVGREIQSICNGYLKPHLTFTDLDYQYPGAVHLKNLRLTASDPSHAGREIDILGARSATVELAEIPRVGQPIKIERIILDHPVVQVIALQSGSRQFVGFSDLFQAADTTAADNDGRKLSDVFQMRQVELIAGRIVYDPRRADQPPMELDDITTRLDIAATSGGWYTLHSSFERKPVVQLTLDGQLNLDSFEVRELALKLKCALDPNNARYLPPELQKLLREHAVRGNLTLSLSGGLPVFDYAKGQLKTELHLDQCRLSAGEYDLKVDSLDLHAALSDGRVTLNELTLSALGGQARLTGGITLDQPLTTQLHLSVVDMRLEGMLPHHPGQAPAASGLITLKLFAGFPMTALLREINPQPAASVARISGAQPSLPPYWGMGFIELAEGRLMDLPALRDIARTVNAGHSDAPRDHGRVDFTLRNNEIVCGRIEVFASWYALRGKGTIKLDQRLDLTLNGGPLEKMESVLGKAGEAIGQVTDALASYNVRGTLDNPQVVMRAGGKALDNAVHQTGREVEKGVTDIGRSLKDLIGR